MPLPLPDLDTRRWTDLVDEGRAVLPRYSPEWTDFNIHDPGIMLVELFAWLSEELMYRANRVPDRHLRKFLELCGYAPAPPLPSMVVLGATLPPGTGTLTLPAGVALEALATSRALVPFRTTDANTLFEMQLVALQSFDGARFRDASRAMRDTLDILVYGPEPAIPVPYTVASAPALYLGFDDALPTADHLQLHLSFADARPGELARLLAEEAARAAACAPPVEACTPCRSDSDAWCDDGAGNGGGGGVSGGASSTSSSAIPPYHSARTVWEWLAADGWHAFDASAGDVVDDTRSLTLDGAVRLRAPGAMAGTVVGAVSDPLYWVRCRFASGAYDAPPTLRAIVFNAMLAEQAQSQVNRFIVAAGATIVGAITIGARTKLALTIDTDDFVRRIDAGVADPAAPKLLILDYVAPTATIAGALTLECVHAGIGTGLPEDDATLDNAPVSRGELSLWTLEGPGAATHWVPWTARDDLDAAGPVDAAFGFDPAVGSIRFGDGVRGRVPPPGSAVMVSYAGTIGASGNVASARTWSLTDAALNHALLGASFASTAACVLRNALPAAGGADAEDIGAAAARAAADLWAHERLVQLCPAGTCATLDQLERDAVLECALPERAATTLDIERNAIDVPGTRVRRARAWSQFDAMAPCAEASGTVTVIIVPSLPRGQPSPSAGLLRAVKRWLERRRVLCTRLLVVGPDYVVVSVTAAVTAVTGADPARVHADVVDALTTFLDPLIGGPAGRGWPFGRDVYRSEILALVDGVNGVDHVTSLAMFGDGSEAACSNLCVAPTSLVSSGSHDITVVRA